MEKVRIRLLISGLVQGVFYRSETRIKAEALGVNGWVKNLSDGSVEIVCEGEKDAVNDLIEWCKKGPSYARVDNVDISYEEPTGEFSSFYVKH